MLGCMLFLRVKPLFVVLSTTILMGIIYGVFTVFLKVPHPVGLIFG